MSEAPPREDGPPSRRRVVRGVVLVTIGGALVLAVGAFATDAEGIADAFARADVGLLAAAVGLSLGNYLLRFGRWHRYLSALDLAVPLPASARIFLVGFLLSVTPGKIGELAKAAMVEDATGQPAERAVAAVVAERYTDLLGMVLLASVGATVLPAGLWLAAAGAAGALVLYALVAWPPFGDAALRIVGRLGPLARLRAPLDDALTSVRRLLRPAELALGVGLAFGAWAAQAGTLALVAAAFGVDFGVLASAFTYAASTLAGVAALLPGGLGVTELGLAGMLRELGGASTVDAVAITILTRLATLWLAVALGALAAPFGLRRPRETA